MLDKNIYCQTLINACHVAFFENELLILCPNDEVFKAVVIEHRRIPHWVGCRGTTKEVKSMTISTGTRRASFPVGEDYHFVLPSMIQQAKSNQIASISESELIAEVLGFPGAASIVRFSDNCGLFSNERIILSSASPANDWIGKNMGDYWLKDELSRYKQALLQESHVSNFCYVAHLFTGQKANFKVDARLVNYRGDLARIVKTISCEPLS